MKSLLQLVLLTALCLQFSHAQQAYYNDVNLNLTGEALYMELQQKISQASGSFTYGEIRDAVKITDENPSVTTDVLLVYGYNDTDGNCTTDRSRDKDEFGGLSCEYNREHVFARGNANPPMGSVDNNTTGIAADPHNVRPSDQQMNNNKGDKKFGDGSGNAGNVGSGNWYPGDEWKGDVARMMMYMYTRYGDRCLPSLNGTGPQQGSTDMLQLYLQWNVEDPVSAFEDQRNPYLETNYGNRNPFIDNPYLATLIWGGPAAEDRWNFFSVEDSETTRLKVFPVPAKSFIQITGSQSTSFEYRMLDQTGKVVIPKNISPANRSIDIGPLSPGLYFLYISEGKNTTIKKIIKQ